MKKKKNKDIMIVGSKKGFEFFFSSALHSHQETILWDDLPKKFQLDEIYSVRIIDFDLQSLPKILGKMNFVGELHIPYHLISELASKYPKLTIEDIVIESYEHNFSFPKNICLLNTKKLAVYNKGVIRFRKENFPNLTELSIRLDSKGKLLDVVAQYHSFKWLYISPARAADNVFSRLSHVKIKRVCLFKGYLDSLNGIEEWKRLQYLRVSFLPKLQYLEPLRKMDFLEELFIERCGSIQDYETLTKIPNLRKLTIVNQDIKKFEKFRKELEKKGIWIDAV